MQHPRDVGGMNRIRDLRHDLRRFLGWKRAVLPNSLRERFPGHVLHRVKRAGIALVHFVDFDDSSVADPPERFHFVHEPFAVLVIRQPPVHHDLDRHRSRRTDLRGPVDVTHTAVTDQIEVRVVFDDGYRPTFWR